MVSSSPVRKQVRLMAAAKKRAAKGHAKGKTLKGPSLKRLKIRA